MSGPKRKGGAGEYWRGRGYRHRPVVGNKYVWPNDTNKGPKREGGRTKPVEKYPINRKVKVKLAAQYNSGSIYRHVWPTPKGGPNIKGGRRSK